MSSRHRENQARRPVKRAGTAQRAPARLLRLVGLTALVAAVAIVVVKSRDTSGPQPSPTRATDTAPPTTTPTTAQGVAPVAAPAPEVLLGKWQRTDGDYALDVRRVGPHGQVEVAYSNPGPINVSRSEVKQDDGHLILFVELRDVNYPGSTYMLAFQPGQDALVGSYHQPASGNTYEVAFLRAK